MSGQKCEGCTFGRLQSDPESVINMLKGLGPFDDLESGDTVVGDAEVLNAAGTPVCPVKGCKLTLGGLTRYITSIGDDAPRQLLDESVAPGCAALDTPHQFDVDLASFWDEQGNPLADS